MRVFLGNLFRSALDKVVVRIFADCLRRHTNASISSSSRSKSTEQSCRSGNARPASRARAIASTGRACSTSRKFIRQRRNEHPRHRPHLQSACEPRSGARRGSRSGRQRHHESQKGRFSAFRQSQAASHHFVQHRKLQRRMPSNSSQRQPRSNPERRPQFEPLCYRSDSSPSFSTTPTCIWKMP